MAFYQYRHACTWKLLKHHSSFWLTTNTWKLEQEDQKWRFKTIPKSKSKFVSLISFLSLPFFSYQTNFNLTKKENYFIRSILLSNKLRRRNSFKNISNPKHQKERKEPKLELKSCKGWRKKERKRDNSPVVLSQSTKNHRESPFIICFPLSHSNLKTHKQILSR